MKPIHKLNGGNGATLCNNCYGMINIGMTDNLLCNKCKGYLDLKKPESNIVRYFNRYKDLYEFTLLPENNILWSGRFEWYRSVGMEDGIAIDPSGGPFIGPNYDMGEFDDLFKGLTVVEIKPFENNSFLIVTK